MEAANDGRSFLKLYNQFTRYLDILSGNKTCLLTHQKSNRTGNILALPNALEWYLVMHNILYHLLGQSKLPVFISAGNTGFTIILR
jgi:hypothetical protein